METIGEHLRKAREKAGLSQKQLGDLMGMDQRNLSRTENDAGGVPEVATLKKFTEVKELGLNLKSLLALRSEMEIRLLSEKPAKKRKLKFDAEDFKRKAAVAPVQVLTDAVKSIPTPQLKLLQQEIQALLEKEATP